MAKYQLKNSSQNRIFGYDALGNLYSSGEGIGAKAGSGVACKIQALGGLFVLDFTFTAFAVTLVKAGTSTAGGGTKFFDFNEGLFLPLGGSTNLVLTAVNATYPVAVGTTVQGTTGTLATTTANILPSTSAVVSTTATVKIKSTVSIPVPGTPIDGTGTACDLFLNACLNADGTGKEALAFTGTARIVGVMLGDS